MSKTMSKNALVLPALALLVAAAVLPAAAQQADPGPVTSGPCTGDYVCVEDPSVVATWPAERWAAVKRRHAHLLRRIHQSAGACGAGRDGVPCQRHQ